MAAGVEVQCPRRWHGQDGAERVGAELGEGARERGVGVGVECPRGADGVEVGQGRVLRGLVKSVDRGASLFGSEDPESVEATVLALEEVAA